jgi:multiple sugar transport system substrate-binding protein
MKKERFRHPGVAGVLFSLVILVVAVSTQPAMSGAPTEITFLHQGHFVPAWEQEIQKQLAAWGKQKGVTTRADFVATAEFNAKLVAEAETRAGHDVVAIRNYDAALYKDSLADLDDIANDLGNQYGGWLPLGKETAFFGGHWKAIPFYHQSFPAVYRMDLLKEAGFSREQVHNFTWDQFLEAAKKLHAKGKPVGFAISQTNDSDCILYPLLWSFGASTVDKSGKVTINSPQTAKAIEYVKELAKYMPQEVLGWDDASNNRFIMSGQGALTFNPPSIWIMALKEVPDVGKLLDHARVPAGPAGRFRSTGSYYLATWKFKSSPLAADLIRFLMQRDNYRAEIEVSGGYNQPFLKEFTTFPIWKASPPLNTYEPVEETLALQGWPGPPEKAAAAQKAWVMHILPVMFGKAVTGTSTQDAMRWAEEELKQLYR